MWKCTVTLLTLGALSLAVPFASAQLSPAVQAVLPSTTQQIVSINYRRLANIPVAQQLESRVLPPGMQGLSSMLQRGGLNPATDINRLTFATYKNGGAVELLGVAEGNFGGLQLARFFHPTKQNPTPPQIDGVSVYSDNGLQFFMPDPATLVFGAHDPITLAIQTEQGAPSLGQNEQMTNLVAGTQSSDVWSVLDASGAQAMVRGMIGAQADKLAGKLIAQRFNGARYTISFQDQVQVNLEMMTSDALSAAALATAIDADVAMRQKQETNPAAKAILQQVQVDSAGNNAFLQISAPASSLADLMNSDLMTAVLR
ncbi:MAG: hypothetical protein ACRD1Y_11990 [Terriglobales bacterium]